MKNWGVEGRFDTLTGETHATVRGEHGAVTVVGRCAAVDALVEALAPKAPAGVAGRKMVLRVVLADGKGGNAAMTFDFPAGHEITVADVCGMEDFASKKFKATMIALAWHWLPVPTELPMAVTDATEEAPTEQVSDLADPQTIEQGGEKKVHNLRAVPALP